MAESNLIFLDTDVLINWLIHERESRSGKPLWPAVEKILQAIQSNKLKGATSIISIMELRTFLREEQKLPNCILKERLSKSILC